MVSLHETSENLKKLALWGAILAGGIIILIILFRIGVSIFSAINPPKIPPPTVTFGKLPPITFPKSVTDIKLTYVNNTVSGRFPNFPDRMQVYAIHQNKGTLLNLEDAKNGVSAIGFTVDPTASTASQIQLSPTDYKWTVNTDISKTITMNIVTKNFSFTSDYMNSPAVLAASYLPNEADAAQEVMGFINQLGAPTNDIDPGKTEETLLTIQNGTLVPAASITSAQVVRVDLFQKDINSFPIVYPTPTQSPMNALVASGLYTGQVVAANYFHESYDQNTDVTYPIISAGTAFNELKKGNAYIASFNGTTSQVLIGNIYLAYFMSDQPQQFLMPVIVFAGDNNFVAYVSAVDYSKTDSLLNHPVSSQR